MYVLWHIYVRVNVLDHTFNFDLFPWMSDLLRVVALVELKFNTSKSKNCFFFCSRQNFFKNFKTLIFVIRTVLQSMENSIHFEMCLLFNVLKCFTILKCDKIQSVTTI